MTTNSLKQRTRYLVFVSACLAILPLPVQAVAPERCAGVGDLQSIDRTDWEAGLGSWTPGTYSIANPDTFDTPDWAVVGNLPNTRPGSAAFVENVNLGDCAADDESGVLTLTGPVIQIPGGVEVPRISIDHWFQTEVDWDGGNIKVSVNGGAFQLLPSSAFVYAPYTNTLNPPFDQFGLLYNLNPLADEPAFTGTADGSGMGSWTQSQILLSGIAQAGDTIQLRLDFGVDDCNGDIGWFVDDLEVYACSLEVEPPVCGNSLLESGEQCDDGNDSGGDGCSQICQVEDGWSCSEPVPPDQASICAMDASLTLVKRIVNNNGGTSVPSDWMLTASGPAGFSGNGPEVTSSAGFEAGSYNLSESSNVNGYQASTWICDGGVMDGSNTVSVGDNERVSCSITNDDAEPALTLVNEVVNDDGGTASASDWVLMASGPAGFSGSGPVVNNGAAFQAGTYTLSTSGGPGGYTTSPWTCSGGTQQGSNAVRIEIDESVTCTVNNDDFDSSTAINVGHSGAWFNPETSGQGVLIDVDPATNFMFIAWFTYTDDNSANPFEQRWLTSQGKFDGNRAEMSLYETLGGRFDDPTSPETLQIGTVTLEFGGCDDAYMSYQLDTEGLQGEFPLVRVIPGSAGICEENTVTRIQAVDINSGMDGAWFDVNTPGQGILIDAKPDPEAGDFMFVAWFTYGDSNTSGQWWLTGQGGFDGASADFPIFETIGGSFDNALPPSTEAIGEMQFEFVDCNNAILTYSIPERTLQGEIEITRVIPGTDALCQQITGAD